MIETHAHIYDTQFDVDRNEMLLRAKQSGVTEIWMPNCDAETLAPMKALARQWPGFLRPMIGLHPCYVKENFEKELYKVEEELAAQHSFIAIGEIGIDLYWDKTYREEQEKAFVYQCELALQHNLWIDIHSRNAFWEVVEQIEKIAKPALTGIFHCFTGTLEEAQKAIELGFKLGIGGVATFKNGGLDKILPFIDPSHLVLETDAPYLAPVPFRGKRNEVAYLDLIAQRVADLCSLPKDRLIALTAANARSLVQEATTHSIPAQ